MHKFDISGRVIQYQEELSVHEQERLEASLAEKLAAQIVGTIPVTIQRDGAPKPDGTALYTYSTTAYVFSEAELVTFIDEIKRADRVLQVCDRMLQRFDGIAN